MAQDLQVAPDDIRNFIAEAQQALQCARVKTNFGKQTSRHWFYVTFARDSELVPTIVTLEVRRARGMSKVYLTEVRPPTGEELVEMGIQPETDNPPFPQREARKAVLEALGLARSSPRPSSEEMRRGILAYDGSALAGEYYLGPWRLSPAADCASTSLISEKILYCDRVISGRDAHDMIFRLRHQLSQLSILLTVFWMRHFYEIRSEHRWFIEPNEEDGQLKLHNKLGQVGYAAEPLPEASLAVSQMSGQSGVPDRLDIRRWATIVGEPPKPPEDASRLYDLFEQADLVTAQRFLEAAKAYHTAHVISPATTTGAIAYLVVAAESLVEETPPVCSECNQPRGILDATRKLFFGELPCLMEDEPKAKALLNRVYQIRSRHFHDAQFMAGELEEWHTPDILLPNSLEYREVHGRFLALVNGLLVAWLIRRVTGKPWERAMHDFPDWREGRHFSVSVQL